MKRFLKKLVKVLAVIAVLVAVLCGILSVVGGRQYEAELQKLKASGEPYTLVDLAGPPIPASRNGAVIYQKVFRLLGIDKPHRRDNPIVVSAEALEAVLKEGNAVPTEAEWGEARHAAPQYDYILPLLEQAAAMPECKFPVRWQDGFTAILPHLSRVRGLGRILGGKAVVYAHEGNADAAIRCFKLCLNTANALKNEPGIIHLLVRIAITGMATNSLRGIMREVPLTPAQAKAAYDALAGVDLRPHYIFAMKGERGLGVTTFAQVRKQGLASIMPMVTGVDEVSPGTAFLLSLDRPLLYLDGAAYLRAMQREIYRADMPYRELKRRGLTRREEPSGFGKLFVFTRILWIYTGRTRAYMDTRLADSAAGQAAMTLVAYKDEFGTYPATLDEASTKLGWKIPPDPFTDKSLIYKRRGKGFIVYSIGANLKGDNGVTKKEGSFGVDAGDVAWSLDR